MDNQNGSTRILIQMLLKLRADYARLGAENRQLTERLLTAVPAPAGTGPKSDLGAVPEDGSGPSGTRPETRRGSHEMKFPVVLIAAAAAATLTALPAEAQFSASPAMVWVDGPATATARVTVRNEGQESAQFRVYTADFDQSAGGDNQFFDAGTQAGSCGDRLTVSPDVTVLEPGQTQDLRLDVAGAESPCWAVVFIQGSGVAETGIRVTQRIGVKVFVGDRSPAALGGEIESVAAAPAADGVEVVFEFRNASATAIRPAGRLELRSLAGDPVAQLEIDPFSVLPGRTRRIEALVPATLPEGRYVAVPVIDFGGEYLAGGQSIFQIH